MGTLLLVVSVLVLGLGFGFVIGYSKGTRDAQPEARTRNRVVRAWMFIIGGGICLVVAGATALYSLHFVLTAVRATGTVVELVERTRKEDGEAMFSPKFLFRDEQGTERTILSSISSSPAYYQVGERVAVFYRSAAPESAKTGDFPHLWALSVVTGVLGTCFVPVGIVVLFWPQLAARFRTKPA